MKTNHQLEQEERFDYFAGLALNALISKSPFLDVSGEFGKQISEDDMREFKKGIADTALEYASWMILGRQTQIDFIHSLPQPELEKK